MVDVANSIEGKRQGPAVRALRIHRLLALAIGLCLGCRVGPEFRTPTAPPMESEYVSALGQASSDEATYWWTYFEDQVLNDLITTACRQNFGVQEAYHRVVEARARLGTVRSGLFPELTGDPSFDHRQSSSNAREFVAVGNAASDFDLYQAGLDASWEIDLFGKIRRSIEAAAAESFAADMQLRQVKVTLLSELATNYINLRVLQQRRQIANDNLVTQSQTLEIVQQRVDAGLARQLDLAQAKSNVHLTSATLPELDLQIAATQNRIAVLLGQSPSIELLTLLGEGAIPEFEQSLDVGFPGDLLRRRPDIQEARAEVGIASARIGVAIADFYPQFTVVGNAGVASRRFDTWFTSQSLTYGFGPSVNWNIFAFGKIRYNVAAERAAWRSSVAAYRDTILHAVEEVENGLVSYARQRERSQALDLAVSTTAKAAELSRAEYSTGLIGFQPVLDSERVRLQTAESRAMAQGAVLIAVVQTYKALGGGWDANCCIPIDATENDRGDEQLPQLLSEGVQRLPSVTLR